MLIKRLYENLIHTLIIRHLFQWIIWIIYPVQWLRKKYWQILSLFLRNIIIGGFIALLILVLHHSAWLQEMENFAMDSMMQLNQSLPRISATTQGLAFTLLDIDEQSYRDWGEPFYTPRDKLLSLIRLAVKQQAKLILVDIDISHAGHNPDADAKLQRFLQQYNENPPLVLLRSFYPDIPNLPQDTTMSQFRPLFFNPDLVGSGVFWAHPLFKKNKHDQLIYYWHLLKAGCENSKASLLPSYQLISHALLHEQQESLADALKQVTPKDCQSQPPTVLTYDDKTLELSSHNIGERIIYTLTGKQDSEEFKRLPARSLLSCLKNPCANDAIKDRVVVIAGNYADARDHHLTPLGVLSGGVIIINAVKSFYMFGQIGPPPLWLQLLLEIILIVCMAWLFSRFSSTVATFIVGIVIVIILIPMSFYFFKFGIWIDFALPILAMQFYQMIAQHEEDLRKSL
ncbi:CHASE2 domain-containing protein [Candidatus Parabeggiatoa sp. HSG14]|uniref:CHASE2 domain-containing protein n=1 Tax=Candidatus Parabeggiatoa sp. HSG14 TaxID=3055593 RepID=UPI0025A79A37|nr:CHASE2 domain-containing protein [Thiotrichales bacterium HSG14]